MKNIISYKHNFLLTCRHSSIEIFLPKLQAKLSGCQNSVINSFFQENSWKLLFKVKQGFQRKQLFIYNCFCLSIIFSIWRLKWNIAGLWCWFSHFFHFMSLTLPGQQQDFCLVSSSIALATHLIFNPLETVSWSCLQKFVLIDHTCIINLVFSLYW